MGPGRDLVNNKKVLFDTEHCDPIAAFIEKIADKMPFNMERSSRFEVHVRNGSSTGSQQLCVDPGVPVL